MFTKIQTYKPLVDSLVKLSLVLLDDTKKTEGPVPEQLEQNFSLASVCESRSIMK